MKKQFKQLFRLSLFFLIMFNFSCAPKFPEQSYIADKPAFDLLIGVQPSEFKDQITRRLVEHYKNKGNIDLVGLNTLKNLECSDYDAVLVMDTCKAWYFFNFSMKSFLKKSEGCRNVILFITAGDPEWEYRYGDLDAVTSASVVGEQDRVFEQLSGKIDLFIAAHRPNP